MNIVAVTFFSHFSGVCGRTQNLYRRMKIRETLKENEMWVVLLCFVAVVVIVIDAIYVIHKKNA